MNSRKGGSPLAIVLLTLGIIVLMISAWFVFLTKQRDLATNLQSVQVMESVAAREYDLEKQMQWIFFEISQRDEDLSTDQFIALFKEEVAARRLKEVYPEFVFIETQLSEETVFVNETEFSVRVRIKIEEEVYTEQGSFLARVVQTYPQTYRYQRPLVSE